MPDRMPTEDTYPELEDRLRPTRSPPVSGRLSGRASRKGQTFRQYQAAHPVRRSTQL